MNKGIVMEMTQAHLIVLTPDGRFMKIPRSSRVCDVGDEIVFATPLFRWKSPFVAFSSSVAAAIVLCVVAFNGITPGLGGIQPIVAYVTLDINPSVELGIDSQEQVQEVKGLNEDGIVLIEQLSYKGKSLSSVTNELMNRVERKGLLDNGEGDIIITSTKAYEEAKIDDAAVSESVKKSVDKHIQEKHPQNQTDIHVASLVAPLDIRQAAQSEGVSVGKYAIYLNAKSIGSAVTIEEIKTQSIHSIAQDRGGLDKLIDTKKVPQKETLSRLLDEERKGELDAKLNEQQSKNGKDDKKNDDKKSNGSNKATPTPDKKQDNSKTSNKPTASPTPTPKKATPTSYAPGGSSNADRDMKAKEEEDRRREVERKKQEEEKKKQDEERKKEEDKKKADEKKKQDDDKKKEDDKRKQDDDRKKLEDEKSKQDEERKKLEEQKKKQDEQKKQDDQKRDDDKRRQDEKKRDDDRNRGD